MIKVTIFFRYNMLTLIAKAPASFLRFTQPRLATFGKYAKVIISNVDYTCTEMLYNLHIIFLSPYRNEDRPKKEDYNVT